jgi:hypothetical protein
VLCRAASELGAEFSCRVMRRARQIRKHCSIGCLWFVLGPPRLEPIGTQLLLESLLPLVDAGGRVMVECSRAQSRVVQRWFEALRGQPYAGIDLQTSLFPDAIETPPSEFASENRTPAHWLDVAI